MIAAINDDEGFSYRGRKRWEIIGMQPCLGLVVNLSSGHILAKGTRSCPFASTHTMGCIDNILVHERIPDQSSVCLHNAIEIPFLSAKKYLPGLRAFEVQYTMFYELV